VSLSKLLHATKFLELMETITEKGSWFWVRRPQNQSAVVIVALVSGKLVVIKEYRVPINGFEFGLPAGLIEKGESIEQAVKRELLEETGLVMDYFLKPPSPFIFSSSGLTNESCSVAYVKASGKLSSLYLEETENIEAMLMDEDEVRALMQNAREGFVNIGAKAWFIYEQYVSGSLF
jgi:ADP-ribose pyrophosphatase